MTATAQRGIVCKIESEDRGHAPMVRLFDGLGAVLVYAALWGGLCSMASLSAIGLLPLALGGLGGLGFVLLEKHRALSGVLLAVSLIAACVLLLAGWPTALDGVKLMGNRLFAASQARQAYTYEMVSVAAAEGAWHSCMRYALVPLGLLTGLAVGAAVRFRLKPVLAALFALFAGLAAYLGVSPEAGWSVLLAAALVLTLLNGPERGRSAAGGFGCAVALAVLAVICGAVFAAMPGEDVGLSAWDEGARDALALHTVAYADQWRPTPEPEVQQPEEEREFYQEEETVGDLGGDEMDWAKPLSVALVIGLLALALFLPAILSDLQKKRRAKNRHGLDDADHSASIQAMFLYTLRWLRLGGLTPANIPFGGYAGQIEANLSKEVRAEFEAVLPLWQEAAYSTHAMDEAQRMRMRSFLEHTRQAVWDGLGKKERLLAKYVYAL